MEVNKLNISNVPPDAAAPAQGDAKLQTTPQLAQAVTAINSAKLFGQDSELTFAMDRESRRTVVRLVDKDSRKVIRQIPPEYLLRLSEDLKTPAR